MTIRIDGPIQAPPPTRLNPRWSIEQHRRDLAASAAAVLKATRAPYIVRDRVLPDDPLLLRVPTGCVSGVAILAADNNGFHRRIAVPVRIAR